MLHEFLTTHREEIISRTRHKVAERPAPRPTEEALKNGVPLFLKQIIDALQRSASINKEIGKSAAKHGSDLLGMGLTVDQVIHGYGDVCQAVTELATERDTPISANDFRIFNQCLDDAIAESVTEYARLRERSIMEEGAEHLGVLAHELRNLLGTAMLSYEMLKDGTIGIGGSTGAVLGRSLRGIRDLIDRSLAEVRLEAGVHKRERVSMAEFLEEVEIAATLEAKIRGIQFTAHPAASDVAVEGDRQMLASAVGNLLQNAFKFTLPLGHVSLRTHTTADRVWIEVEDECGGLPPGKVEELFLPFQQRSADRTGLGLGLSISRRCVEANGGAIHLRNLPGQGCIFTVDLPRLLPLTLDRLSSREPRMVRRSYSQKDRCLEEASRHGISAFPTGCPTIVSDPAPPKALRPSPASGSRRGASRRCQTPARRDRRSDDRLHGARRSRGGGVPFLVVACVC